MHVFFLTEQESLISGCEAHRKLCFIAKCLSGGMGVKVTVRIVKHIENIVWGWM